MSQWSAAAWSSAVRRRPQQSGHHGIDWDAASGDQDARLAGGTKVNRNAAAAQAARQAERSILFAQGAIGSHCEQRLPVRRRPVAIGNRPGAGDIYSRRPSRSAVAARFGISSRRVCMPLTRSRPASSALISTPDQRIGIEPPIGAIPITRLRAPRASAQGRRQYRQPGGNAGAG